MFWAHYFYSVLKIVERPIRIVFHEFLSKGFGWAILATFLMTKDKDASFFFSLHSWIYTYLLDIVALLFHVKTYTLFRIQRKYHLLISDVS